MNSLIIVLAAMVAGDNVNHNGGWTTSYTYIIGDSTLSINGGGAFSGENELYITGTGPGSATGNYYDVNTNDNSLIANSPYTLNVRGKNDDEAL